MAVTKRQAEQAFRQFKQQFKALLPVEGYPNGPKLIHNWDWSEGGPTRWAIVWEEGPYEWAMACQTGGSLDGYYAKIPAAKHWPVGTFSEPVTSWAVGIYEV